MTVAHLAELRREAFLRALHDFPKWHPDDAMPTVDLDGAPIGLDELAGLLWQDRRCLAPVDERALLDSHGDLLVSYASAARYVFRALKSSHTVVT